MEEIGSAIARLRRGKKWSQTNLAEKAGVSRSFVSTLERGVASEAGLRKVERILSLFGCRLAVAPQAGPPTLEDLQRDREAEDA